MESQIINCPHCKQATAAKESHAGKSVRCPHCRSVFQVPKKEVKAVREDVDDSLPVISVSEGSPSATKSKQKPGVPLGVTASAFFVLMVLVVWNGAAIQNTVRSFTGLGGVEVSGELFFTPGTGNVVKGAGLEVYMSPMNDSSKKEFSAIIEQRYPLEKVHNDKAYKQLRSLDKQAMQILTDRMHTIHADSDGKFKAVIPPGDYALWTTADAYGEMAFIWCTAVKVEKSNQSIFMNDEHIIMTKYGYSTPTLLRMDKPTPPSGDLLDFMLHRVALKLDGLSTKPKR